jgi:dTDP-4-dehydrorhamnose reductase
LHFAFCILHSLMSRVLVTGANGLLGTKVIEQSLARADIEIVSTSRGSCQNRYLGSFPFSPLDITDGDAVKRVLSEHQPDVIIHTAAMTNVDGCETNREEAWAINVNGTENVARACQAVGARLVHLSSEYVYDGTAGPYRETDRVNPLGWYAKTKWESEKRVRAIVDNAVIGRTTVIVGQAPHVRPNFVLWLVNQLRSGRRANIVVDQIGSPTLADNLAEMVLALALSDVRGVYHTAGDTVIGRYDYALLIADVFDLDTQLLVPITTAELKQPAPRPLKAGLLMEKFKRDFPNVHVLTAREGVEAIKAQTT